MTRNKNGWGVTLGVSSIVLCGIVVYCVLTYPPPLYTRFYQRVIPYLGILFSLASVFIGHFSYPRVHNLKVYLAGYLSGMTSAAYFLLFITPRRHEEAITALCILMFINILLFILIPSYVKYRITRRITYTLVAAQSILILLARFYHPAVAWAKHVDRSVLVHAPVIIAFLWLVAVTSLCIFKLKNEFHLGGIFSGFGLLFFMIWLLPSVFHSKHALGAEKILFALVNLYLIIGIITHWFYRIEHRISYDPLLQIYNRNFCSKIIEEQSNVKTTPPLAIAMIDIDHFKKVNDTYGHQAGDKVLHSIAQIIQRDIVPDGIACRYGGEEIIVFFPNKKTNDIFPAMEKLRSTIEKAKIQVPRKKLTVTISCGISQRETVSQNIMDVIHAADKALYKAKNNGRNQVKSAKTSLPSAKKR